MTAPPMLVAASAWRADLRPRRTLWPSLAAATAVALLLTLSAWSLSALPTPPRPAPAASGISAP